MSPSRRTSYRDIEEQLPSLLERLKASRPLDPERVKIPKSAGVYLFSEGRKHLYVGQTRNVRRRYSDHHRGTERQSHFAYNLARAEWEAAEPRVRRPRPEVAADASFQILFEGAVERLRSMKVRFVEISDPALRTVFEVYAALELRTPYNNFETH